MSVCGGWLEEGCVSLFGGWSKKTKQEAGIPSPLPTPADSMRSRLGLLPGPSRPSLGALWQGDGAGQSKELGPGRGRGRGASAQGRVGVAWELPVQV